MSHVSVADLGQHVGKTVVLAGWLYNRRSSKKLHFLELRDGTGAAQCVLSQGDATPELCELAGKLGQESSLEVTGEVRAHPKRANEYEVAVRHLSPIGAALDYPISPKEHGTDFLMDHRHLWLRSRRQ